MLKKKNLAVFKELYLELFTQKFVTKLKKYGLGIRDPGSWIRDPGSGIRKKPIPDTGSGSRGQKSTGSWIPDPDPQHCSLLFIEK
jgi:hypothetical protein